MNCPACAEGTRHTPEELAQYHPLAGHGFVEGQGWCCPEAERAHNEEIEDRYGAGFPRTFNVMLHQVESLLPNLLPVIKAHDEEIKARAK